MNSAQPEFDLSTPPRDESLDTLLAVLETETGWTNAAALLVKLGHPPTEANKRKLRDLANQSQGQIISGQKGYKHIRHATADEMNHAANWLLHQAKAMSDRATQILRQYHQLPHTPRT